MANKKTSSNTLLDKVANLKKDEFMNLVVDFKHNTHIAFTKDDLWNTYKSLSEKQRQRAFTDEQSITAYSKSELRNAVMEYATENDDNDLLLELMNHKDTKSIAKFVKDNYDKLSSELPNSNRLELSIQGKSKSDKSKVIKKNMSELSKIIGEASGIEMP